MESIKSKLTKSQVMDLSVDQIKSSSKIEIKQKKEDSLENRSTNSSESPKAADKNDEVPFWKHISDQYEFIDLIAQGAYGQVYKARQIKSG